MAITNVVKTSIYEADPDTPAVSVLTGDVLKLLDDIAIVASGSGASPAIHLEAQASVSLAGNVYSTSADGIFSTGGGNRITIAQTGSIFGFDNALNLAAGGNTIRNLGSINTANGYGILIAGTGGNIVDNSGTIQTRGAVVSISGSGNQVTNSGLMEASPDYVTLFFNSNNNDVSNVGVMRGGVVVRSFGQLSFTNSGLTEGTSLGDATLDMRNDADSIVNSGSIVSHSGIAVAFGGGADVYDGRGGTVIGKVLGEAGTDTLTGGSGAETFDGGADNDKLYGGGGTDQLIGGEGNDLLDGQTGIDTLDGGLGNDRYFVDSSSDQVIDFAGGGTDTVYAGVNYALKADVEVERLYTTKPSATTTIALTGNDYVQAIEGNNGINTLKGLGGNDQLSGLAGADKLYGGFGRDKLTGGTGNDNFYFDTAIGNGDVDTIVDFRNVSGNDDTIRLENAIFGSLATTGTLNSAFFKANATGTATDANDFIVYNTKTGSLFYDADGNGAGAAIQFAVLSGHPALTATDFVVF